MEPHNAFTAPSFASEHGGAQPGPHIAASQAPREIPVEWGALAAKPVLDDLFLIQGVLPKKGVAALYGPPGSGKSFLAIDMAYSIAAGRAWHGRAVEQGVVLYCALEGQGIFPNRLAASVSHHELKEDEQGRFGLIRAKLDLRTPSGDTPALIELARRLEGQGERVRLVVIDTLNRGFAGGNENSPDDMGMFLERAAELVEAAGCCLLIVHHCGKDISAGLRGHSSLLGALDTEMRIQRTDGGRLLTVTKQRDAEDGVQVGFDLATVHLGETPAGYQVTSAVAVPVDPSLLKAAKSADKLGGIQQVVLRALKLLVCEPECARNPAGPGWPEPGKFAIAAAEDVINKAKGLIDPPEKGEDRRRDKIKRALDGLASKGVIGRNEGMLWGIESGARSS